MNPLRIAMPVAITCLACAGILASQRAVPCERTWTFPVPFFQSLDWSPDGSKLAVSAVATSWDEGYRIFILRADRAEPTRLETGGERDLYPTWSPDGSRLAFSSNLADNSDIYVAVVDGSQIVRLTQDAASDSYPSWSPDGTQIAFHSNRDGNFEIYTVNADGSDLRRLTDDPADDYSPRWSPDGLLIAFEADRDGDEKDELYVVAPDGSAPRKLADWGVFPTWAPDGKSLLFVSDALYTLDLKSGEARYIRDNVVYASWSPDGSEIAAAVIGFDDECKDHHSIVGMLADGSSARKIVDEIVPQTGEN